MSGAAGMAIDPSLLFLQGQKPPHAPSTTQNKGKGKERDPAVEPDFEGAGDEGMAGSTSMLEQGMAQVETPMDSKDDATLAAFLARMDEYEPLLPDAVTRYYLERAGFQCTDERVTRLLGLAAQKFVSDIASDAFAYSRTRTMAGPGRVPGSGNAAAQASAPKNKDRTKTTLTMEDLSAALQEYGIDASRAPYYR